MLGECLNIIRIGNTNVSLCIVTNNKENSIKKGTEIQENILSLKSPI